MSETNTDLHQELPETCLSARIDAMVRAIGDTASWVWLALLVTIVANVLLRYVFGEGRIEFEELQWHLYAVGFLVGLAYGVESDDHVRVDFLRAKLSLRMQAWIELYGMLLLLLPFVALVLYFSVPFIQWSWAHAEVSQAPGGLPFRWLIKSVLFAGFALLGLSVFSRMLRVSSYLFGAPLAIEAVTEQNDGAA